MRETLSEILKQSSPFPVLKVIGSAQETAFTASSECKTFIFKAVTKMPIPEFLGEFGITNLSLLTGLLNFSSYRTDSATFNVKRRVIGDREIVEQLEFSAKKGSRSAAVFRLTSPDLIPEIVQMSGKNQPTWDVEFVPDRAKVTEFQQLANLYSEVGKTFIPQTDDDELVFYVGNKNASTHNASMVFQEGVQGTVSGDLNYSVAMFATAMKMAGAHPVRLSLKSRSGPMKITVDTDHATYDYIIRGAR